MPDKQEIKAPKRRAKRWISFIAFSVLILTTVLLFVIFGEKTTPVEDLEYEFDDGYVVITGYKGSDLEIILPKEIDGRPVIAIGEEAFRGYDLRSVEIPDGVQEIGKYAFADCVCLEEIELPDTLTSIKALAFDDCASLDNVDLPNSLTYIGIAAFDGCELLKEVRLPASVELAKQYVHAGGYTIESYMGIFEEGCSLIFSERSQLVYDLENDMNFLKQLGYAGEVYTIIVE